MYIFIILRKRKKEGRKRDDVGLREEKKNEGGKSWDRLIVLVARRGKREREDEYTVLWCVRANGMKEER